jgi:Core-2/I-Branching enzyme
MEIAYIISAYKYPQQLIRLIERLNTYSTSFFVHVDKKTEEQIFHQMANSLIHLSNIHFLKRSRYDWGGFGHVAATLEWINELFESGTDFDHAILLTGQDSPIKSNRSIDVFLEEHKGKLFMEFFALPHEEWQKCGMDRIEVWHWHVLGTRFTFSPGRRFSHQTQVSRLQAI